MIDLPVDEPVLQELIDPCNWIIGKVESVFFFLQR